MEIRNRGEKYQRRIVRLAGFTLNQNTFENTWRDFTWKEESHWESNAKNATKILPSTAYTAFNKLFPSTKQPLWRTRFLFPDKYLVLQRKNAAGNLLKGPSGGFRSVSAGNKLWLWSHRSNQTAIGQQPVPILTWLELWILAQRARSAKTNSYGVEKCQTLWNWTARLFCYYQLTINDK